MERDTTISMESHPDSHNQRRGFEDSSSHRIFGYDLTKHPPHIQLTICITGVIFLYLFYGYFQERIFKIEGFKFGWYLTFVQFLIYSALAIADTALVGEYSRRAPLRNYAAISFFMVLTMGLSNTSLQYLNYPTQLLFKSCKIIPVMLGGVILLRKKYSVYEYVSAILLTLGLCELTLGNASSDPLALNLVGTGIILCALCADAFIGNFQEGTMTQFNVSSREMALYSHMMGSVQLFFVLIVVGQLGPAFYFCWEHPTSYLYMLLFSCCGYVGANFVLVMIKLFGAFVTTTVTSCRKFITLALSFLFFPKPFTIHYVIATFLVVFGIIFHIYAKNADFVDKYLLQWLGFKRLSDKSSSTSLPLPSTQQHMETLISLNSSSNNTNSPPNSGNANGNHRDSMHRTPLIA